MRKPRTLYRPQSCIIGCVLPSLVGFHSASTRASDGEGRQAQKTLQTSTPRNAKLYYCSKLASTKMTGMSSLRTIGPPAHKKEIQN